MSISVGFFRQNALHGSILCILAAGAVAGGAAQAATQGTMGATSTGTVAISASVPNRAQISGLTDVAFTNQNPSVAASSAQNVCVWSNSAARGYTIRASGSGAANAFTLANAGLTVPYSVQWNSSSGQTSGTALTAAVATPTLNSTATDATCSSGPTSSASLIIGISASDLSTMQAATSYTGTLTLLMTPI